jgi:hypothetical protein
MKTIKVIAISALVIGAFCFGKSYQGKHPHMEGAKLKLNEAKNQLQKAEHDYNGHRAKAIEHINMAIKEIDEGIASQK